MDWTGGSPRGTPLGQACPCRAKRRLGVSQRAWLAPHPRALLAKDEGCSHGGGLAKDEGYTHGGNGERTRTTPTAVQARESGGYNHGEGRLWERGYSTQRGSLLS